MHAKLKCQTQKFWIWMKQEQCFCIGLHFKRCLFLPETVRLSDIQHNNMMVRPGNVGNYCFNFTLRHPLSLCMEWWKMTLLKVWSPGWSVVGRSCFRSKVVLGRSRHRAKVFYGPKYSPGPSMLWAEVCSGPKWVSGQSCLWAKLGVSSQEVCKTIVST